MEAYDDEVRKLEERFDGLQMEHVPRAENDIADGLSKCAALKLPVEPGTFVLKLTQPSVTSSTGPSKKRKSVSGDYLPAELLGNVVISIIFLRTRKIMVMHSNEMRVLSTYPRRPATEALTQRRGSSCTSSRSNRSKYRTYGTSEFCTRSAR